MYRDSRYLQILQDMLSRAFERDVVYLISIGSGWHGGAGPKAPERELGSSAEASQLNAFPTHNSSFQISPFMPLDACFTHLSLTFDCLGPTLGVATLLRRWFSCSTLSASEQYPSTIQARLSLNAASQLAFWRLAWPTPVAIFVGYTQPIHPTLTRGVCLPRRAN